ncbi:MAG: hypothetical protein IIC13_11545 [SAR324 cluster bacterium]|nr:hypothetical protein [SAR324 cluster bacterium]
MAEDTMAENMIAKNMMAKNTMAKNTMPTTQALLSLVEKVANLALSGKEPSGKHFLAGVRLTPGGIELRLRISGLAALVDGEYPLLLTILDTTAERTRFSWCLPRARGMTRLMGLGMKALPAGWLNEALGRLSGGAFSAEGETVILDHKALLGRAGCWGSL